MPLVAELSAKRFCLFSSQADFCRLCSFLVDREGLDALKLAACFVTLCGCSSVG